MGISGMTSGGAGDTVRRLLFMQTRISMDSSGFLQIDSCRRLMECSDIYVKIRTIDMIVEVWGGELEISCMSADSIIIRGSISSMEFTKYTKGGTHEY